MLFEAMILYFLDSGRPLFIRYTINLTAFQRKINFFSISFDFDYQSYLTSEINIGGEGKCT